MGWVPDNVIEATRYSHQLGIFMHLATTPPFRVWCGVNDIPAGFDSIDADGVVYLGAGRLIGIPTLELLVNGAAGSVDFTLSGIDPATGAALLDSIPAVRGVDFYIGLTTLDDYFQPMSAIIPIWQARASHVGESSQTVTGETNPTLSLALSVVTGEPTRSRPSRAIWSAAMQKTAVSSTDRFCDNTARYARGVQPVWPHYS